MAHLLPNSFSSYNLTEEDIIEGSILTNLQLQVIQNLLATKAEEKLALEYNIDKPNEFIQQEAYHKGAIDLLRYLIDQSIACTEIRNNPNLK